MRVDGQGPPSPDRPPEGARQAVRRGLGFGLGYLLLALLFTWPAPLTATTRTLGLPGDALTNVWNVWWTHQALFVRGQSPFHTDLLLHPEGADLWLHTLSPLNAVAGACLVPLLPLALIYDLLVWLHLVLAGLAAAALSRRVSGSEPGAFVAGAVFMLSAWHAAHAAHLNLVSTAPLPLALLALLRGAGSERPLRWGLLAAGAIAAAGLLDAYLFMFAGLAAATAVAALAVERGARTRRHALAGAAALLLPLLVLAPLLLRMVRAAAVPQQNTHDPLAFSADLLGFLIPGPISAWGAPFAPVWSRFSGNELELATFVGPLTLALGLFGLWRGVAAQPARRVLVALLLLGFLLSLGPTLQVLGVRTGVPGPYRLLVTLFPPLSMAGVPVRFALLCDLSLAVLAGAGVARLAAGRPRRAALGLAALAVGLRLVEQLPVSPFPTLGTGVPGLYAHVARDERAVAVLDLTTLEDQALPLLHQTVHRKPIVGGYLARTPRSYIQTTLRTPVVRQLVLRTRIDDLRARATPAQVAAGIELAPAELAAERNDSHLRRLGVAWVVTANDPARELCEALGYERVAEEGPRTLFRVF